MDHDKSYKLLFSHPEMIADLLRVFIHQKCVQHPDFDSLAEVLPLTDFFTLPDPAERPARIAR